MVQSFFQWMQGLEFSNWILMATWVSPVLQCLHLMAICVFAGALLIVDIRLLGKGLTSTPVAQLARNAEKWMICSFAVLIVTGVPQMMSTALKQYYSPHFWLKMQIMGFALLFTFTVRRAVALADEGSFASWVPKLVAVLSMGCWMAVTIWARLIGLLS